MRLKGRDEVEMKREMLDWFCCRPEQMAIHVIPFVVKNI